MKDDGGGPPSPELLADYEHFCRLFGPMPFAGFVVLWREADAFMREAGMAGYGPADVPRLFAAGRCAPARPAGRRRRALRMKGRRVRALRERLRRIGRQHCGPTPPQSNG